MSLMEKGEAFENRYSTPQWAKSIETVKHRIAFAFTIRILRSYIWM